MHELRPHPFTRLGLLTLAVTVASCGDGTGSVSASSTRFQDKGPPAESSDAGPDLAEELDTRGPAVFVDAALVHAEPDGAFASCAAIELSATVRSVPMDIVWVIDSSPSMSNERSAIQTNLNRFAATFASAEIDVRVVVMTDGDDFEVAAPLGTDPKRFLFVDRNVGSDDALRLFVQRFDEYSAFLRREAKLELIAVTDDESNLSAQEFLARMRTAAGKDFRLHAIASERLNGRACPGATSPGDEYYEAAAATGGLTFSVCQADSTGLFQDLADGLTDAAPLPCSLTIPDPPNGQRLDHGLVNVVPHGPPGTSQADAIPSVANLEACADFGWFYEDSATISLCPRTCERFDTGTLSVEFGCATRVF